MISLNKTETRQVWSMLGGEGRYETRWTLNAYGNGHMLLQDIRVVDLMGVDEEVVVVNGDVASPSVAEPVAQLLTPDAPYNPAIDNYVGGPHNGEDQTPIAPPATFIDGKAVGLGKHSVEVEGYSLQGHTLKTADGVTDAGSREIIHKFSNNAMTMWTDFKLLPVNTKVAYGAMIPVFSGPGGFDEVSFDRGITWLEIRGAGTVHLADSNHEPDEIRFRSANHPFILSVALVFGPGRIDGQETWDYAESERAFLHDTKLDIGKVYAVMVSGDVKPAVSYNALTVWQIKHVNCC